MPTDISHKLVIAISSRALFDLDESNTIYEKEGVEQYAEYQIAHENDILKPGIAFPLVQKLLRLNQHGDFVEIILLSRNSADTGLRIFNSIAHYELDITRAAFTSGESPYQYIQAFGSHLFLSTHANDVKTIKHTNTNYALHLTVTPFYFPMNLKRFFKHKALKCSLRTKNETLKIRYLSDHSKGF